MPESAKEVVLGRIRAALAGAPDPAPVPRAYVTSDERSHAAIVDELAERLADYKALVSRVASAALPEAIADACARHGIRRLAAPADVPATWIPAGVEARRDDPPLSNEELDGCDGVLTGCAVAIGQTGTIVLDGGVQQGRRALSLVPDRHLCVVTSEQIVGSVPEGIAALAAHPARAMTLISGPSATSDIELSRVEGVHGPRTLHVLIVE
jgi:L-lactate dehydrogenase complex protein LldG